jgi:hypothetical protein
MSDEGLGPRITAYAAEYAAIRAEICAFHTVEGQVMQITIAVISVLTVLLGLGDYRPFIHLVPIPFVALGIIFAYTQARIIQGASYLHKQLRPQVEKNLNVSGQPASVLWNWEIFRRSDDCPVRMLATWLNSGRWLFFIAPALFPLTLWKREFQNVGDFLLVVWDLLPPLFLTLIAIWSSALLPGRVIGERRVRGEA